MTTQFTFPNKVAGDSLELPLEARLLVDAAFAKRNAIVRSDNATKEEKKAALRAFRSEVKWSTIYKDVDGVSVPTAILTVSNI